VRVGTVLGSVWGAASLRAVCVLGIAAALAAILPAALPAASGSAGGSADGQLSSPKGLAVDYTDVIYYSDEKVYVADTGNHRVQVFHINGTFDFNFGSYGSAPGQFSSPEDILVAGGGVIYVADTGNHRVQVFHNNGAFIRQIGSYGSGDGQLSSPEGMGGQGYVLYVADTGNHRIQAFDTRTGEFLFKFGSYGSGYYQFSSPGDVHAFGDYIDIADTGNHRVHTYRFTPSHHPGVVTVFDSGTIFAGGSYGSGPAQFKSPQSIHHVNAVADTYNHRVLIVGPIPLLSWRLQIGSYGTGDGQLRSPEDVVRYDLKYFVADTGNHRIQVFHEDRTFAYKFGSGDAAAAGGGLSIGLNGTPGLKLGSRGAGGGEFGWADGAAYGPSGEIAVVDWGNHRVQAFHPNGTLAFKVGSRGSADGQFFYPAGVAYGPSGELAVADSGNHRVQVFSPPTCVTACVLSLLEAVHFSAVLKMGPPQGFAPDGVFDHTLGSRGSADGQFYWPSGVAYGPSGELAVADSGNHRVQVFGGGGWRPPT